jgi:CHAT domain-containing protein
MARTINDSSFVAAALLGLSQAEQLASQFDRAKEYIERAIAHAENLRSAIREDSIKVSYYATRQALFNQAILVALAQNLDALALQYAEQARARALHDVLIQAPVRDLSDYPIAQKTATIPDVPTLQRSIPAFAQVIEYRLTPEALVIWLLDRQRIVVRRVAVTAPELTKTVQEFLRSTGAEERQAFQARVDQDQDLQPVYRENCRLGRQLYDHIWAPIADAILPDKMLYIIPDGILYHVPFGALPITGERFWEEQHLYVKAPSLAILAESASWPKPMTASRQSRLLMVAGDLPSANAQKKLLARLFVEPRFLINNEATYAYLQDRLHVGAEIIYFSVHAVADRRYPMNSYIELYDNPRAGRKKAKTYARQLLALNFAKTSLVALNACETSGGKIVGGEGALNLVRVFSLAQVPAVVASLWQNDDRYSADLMNDFFKKIAEGQDAASALHHAKLKLIGRLRGKYRYALPYFWAAFEAYQNQWGVQPDLKLI